MTRLNQACEWVPAATEPVWLRLALKQSWAQAAEVAVRVRAAVAAVTPATRSAWVWCLSMSVAPFESDPVRGCGGASSWRPLPCASPEDRRTVPARSTSTSSVHRFVTSSRGRVLPPLSGATFGTPANGFLSDLTVSPAPGDAGLAAV